MKSWQPLVQFQEEYQSMQVKPNSVYGQRGDTILRRAQHHLALRRRCTFSFGLIEKRSHLSHSVFGEPRDGMDGMDRGLTTRGELPLNSLDYSSDHFIFGCVDVRAAAPRCERRRAWRKEYRRVLRHQTGYFTHNIHWFVLYRYRNRCGTTFI